MAGTSNNAIALTKQEFDRDNARKHGLNKEEIINFFFRFESLVDDNNKIRTPESLNLERITKKTSMSKSLVLYVLNIFFRELNEFHNFLNTRYENWLPGKNHIYGKLIVYLEKLYDMAPIFNYQRAKKNIDVLHYLLSNCYYWPHITTQLALLIFVTDRNDTNVKDKAYILQKNLRMLCACSAYAFHSARNKLNISKEGNVRKLLP
ncbi:MAG: hypothetical protein ACFE96_06550 [Candidatus Hermodarchaeota archaeon]